MPLIKNINQFNDRIDIQEKTSGQNEDGEIVTSWKKVGSLWTYVKTRTLNDIKTSAGSTYQDTINFVIRYDQDLTIKRDSRIVWKGNKYEIVKINPDTGMKEFTVIVAKEIG